jgi:pentatricopeptide repeat protein
MHNAMARTAVERMWKLKVVPDVNIFTSLIQLCTRCKDVNRAFEVLELMRLFDVRPDAFVYTSLINAGAKAPLPPPPCACAVVRVRVRLCVCVNRQRAPGG